MSIAQLGPVDCDGDLFAIDHLGASNFPDETGRMLFPRHRLLHKKTVLTLRKLAGIRRSNNGWNKNKNKTPLSSVGTVSHLMKKRLQIVRSFNLRFAIALLLLAILVSGALYSLNLVIESNLQTAAAVNISGRQRMLSQQIALEATRMAIETDLDEQGSSRSALAAAIDQFETNHFDLVNGNEARGIQGRMSTDLTNLYFNGPDAVDPLVREFLASARELVDAPQGSLSQNMSQLLHLQAFASERLLPRLEAAVAQIQEDGQARIKLLKQMEMIVWSTSILVLLLEAWFIFLPFSRTMRQTIGELEEARIKAEASEAEMKLRRHEIDAERVKFKRLLENATDGIHVMSKDGRLIYYSRSFARQLGYDYDEMQDMNIADWDPSVPTEKVMSTVVKALKSGKTVERTQKRKDGRLISVQINMSEIHLDGELCIYASQRDVTQEKLLLKDLELIHSSAKIASFRTDVVTDEQRYSQSIRDIFELGPEEVFDRNRWLEMIHPEDVEPVQTKTTEIFERGDRAANDLNYRIVTAKGNIKHVSVGWMFADDTHLLGYIQDVTEEAAITHALQEAKEAAESASQAKSDFLANISHEIRTPLNSMIGQTWMLQQRRDIGPQVQQDIRKVRVAGELLLSLVNDVLDMSKIEAGEINLEVAPMRIVSVLDDLASLFALKAEAKGLDLLIGSLPGEASCNLVGDPTRLRQILVNLLNNAIKFTNSGQVSLSIELVEPVGEAQADADHQRLRFTVQDTGIGISKDVLPKLFRAFQQADSSTTRKFGGTGLGLALVKQLSEAMGGEVRAESALGGGSRFIVELPFRIATDEEIHAIGFFEKPLQVIVAESKPDEGRALASMCREFGCDVETVPDGESLLGLWAERAREGRRVDCLVFDRQVSGVDGLQALQRMHDHRGREENIPATVLVASEGELASLQQSVEAKLADAILERPVELYALFNQMNIALFNRTGNARRLRENMTLDNRGLAWLAGVRILLVDDSPMNHDVIGGILETQGARVANCMNGAEAIDWLLTPGNSAEIVLMDVQMPVMDGNTAVEKIRTMEDLEGLPVIALTATALASERQRSLEAGMDDYLTKPFDPEHMVRVIRKHVEAQRGEPIGVCPSSETLKSSAA